MAKTSRPVVDSLDQQLLHNVTPPKWADGRHSTTLRLADLFSGCGGMSLGVALAARERKCSVQFSLALDTDHAACAVHEANFRGGFVDTASVENYFDGGLGESKLTDLEKRTLKRIGQVDILVGGPPCQGNSNLNNHTRRADSRNALYAKMARAARVLKPRVVIIENVPTVVHDKGGIVGSTIADLTSQGYDVGKLKIPMTRTGVPQLRQRFVLLAVRSLEDEFNPQSCLDQLVSDDQFAVPRDIRWAIRDLKSHAPDSGKLVDTLSNPSVQNQARMQWLITHGEYDLPDRLRPPCHRLGGHTYRAIYGRMKWREPAHTITTGFVCNGQGRYVHPQFARTITPHEAARIQTFPDFFDFEPAGCRTAIARMVGNAVPPFFMRALMRKLLPSLL